MVKVKVGAIMQVAQKYSFTHPRIKLQKCVYELGDHVGEEALSLNLPLKLGTNKTILLGKQYWIL